MCEANTPSIQIETLKARPAPPSSAQGGANGDTAVPRKQDIPIRWRHVEASLNSTRPSISLQERERLRRIYDEFIGARNGEMPSGQGSTEVGGRSSLM